MPNLNWICCQLGAREHYAVPRALHQAGVLSTLITDAWVTPQSFFNQIPGSAVRSLRDRYHPDLAEASVAAFTPSLLTFEAGQRLRKTGDWDRIMARNRWFQNQAMRSLQKLAAQSFAVPPTLFTYSYAALELLQFAKRAGWQTVLGQIDPGIFEEKIVLQAQQNHPDLAPHWQPVPSDYWQRWQSECVLADHIVVNSVWSKVLLQKAGVPEEKIHIVPLVYQSPVAAKNFVRHYPSQFSRDRPLRVLFLGLVTLRKGIAACLEAIEHLRGQPVEFWFVGTRQIDIPAGLQNHPQVRWIGPVPRSETAQYYQQADVFLFPTLSDGFGLTQLEAQAWKLPIIASEHCGQVVEDGKIGWLLKEVSGKAIADPLLYYLHHPENLAKASSQINAYTHFQLQDLSKTLNDFVCNH